MNTDHGAKYLAVNVRKFMRKLRLHDTHILMYFAAQQIIHNFMIRDVIPDSPQQHRHATPRRLVSLSSDYGSQWPVISTTIVLFSHCH